MDLEVGTCALLALPNNPIAAGTTPLRNTAYAEFKVQVSRSLSICTSSTLVHNFLVSSFEVSFQLSCAGYSGIFGISQ